VAPPGLEVTILEGLPVFLGAVDEGVAKEAHKAFTKQGLKIELGVKVGEIKTSKKGVSVAYTNAKGEAADAGCGQAHRLHRPRAQHHRPEHSRRWGWRWTSAVRSWWMPTARPTCPVSGRWAMWCAARCWRTRPKKRALPWPSALPVSTVTSTSTPSLG